MFEKEQSTPVFPCAVLRPLVLLLDAFKQGKELQSLDIHHTRFAGYTTVLKVFITGIDSFHRHEEVHESSRVNYFIMPVIDEMAPIPQYTQAVKMRSVVTLVFRYTVDW